MADAVEMREHRHTRVVLHPLDQALASARHDHVDKARGAQHGADRLAVLGRHQLHGLRRHAGAGEPFGQGSMDRAVGMHRFAPAAQQHGIARAHAQGRGIGSHIGAAFIDDAYEADGNAYPREPEPAGYGAGVNHFTHRVRQGSDRLDPGGDPFKPLLVQRKPVEHGGGEPTRPARLEIALVGGEYLRALGTKRACRRAERRSLLIVGHPREPALGCAPGAGKLPDEADGIVGCYRCSRHGESP